MKEILTTLISGEKLTHQQSKKILSEISEGKHNQAQIAAFLTVFMMRKIEAEELSGFRDALLEKAVHIDFSDFNTVDLCGTGGDGKNTFNISTLASFITAGAGYKVVKHGNYAVSSSSGSSNVLEYYGAKFTNNPHQLKKQLENSNFTYFHAPFFHPAMKYVAPIRKGLELKTFFNMLGPLLNPSNPKNQLIGVFNKQTAELFNQIFEKSNKNYFIIHSLDGYDEISLTDNAISYSNLHKGELVPADFGFEQIKPNDIFGGNDIIEVTSAFENILKNKGTDAQNHVACANSALAIKCFEPEKSIKECTQIALESLKSGKAKKAFELYLENQY